MAIRAVCLADTSTPGWGGRLPISIKICVPGRRHGLSCRVPPRVESRGSVCRRETGTFPIRYARLDTRFLACSLMVIPGLLIYSLGFSSFGLTLHWSEAQTQSSCETIDARVFLGTP